MKLQRNFCDLTRFLQVNAGLKCRAKCNDCQRTWKETGTKAVSRSVGVEKVNGRFVEKVFYLCDGCAEKAAENNGVDTLLSECK